MMKPRVHEQEGGPMTKATTTNREKHAVGLHILVAGT